MNHHPTGLKLIPTLTPAQANVEVEIREAPKLFPVDRVGHGILPPAPGDGMATAALADMRSSLDSGILSPGALFRSYLEREKRGARAIPEEVRPCYAMHGVATDTYGKRQLAWGCAYPNALHLCPSSGAPVEAETDRTAPL